MGMFMENWEGVNPWESKTAGGICSACA